MERNFSSRFRNIQHSILHIRYSMGNRKINSQINMVTKTEDRHAKREESLISGKKGKGVLNRSKAWRRRRTT